MNEDGREKVYSLDIPRQAVNAGVVVVRPELKLERVDPRAPELEPPIHPWFLGSLDENDVTGYAGIPVNSNGSMPGLPLQRRRRRRRVPAGRALLRLRRLGPRSLHRPLARRPVHAPLLGERRDGRRTSAAHDEDLGRPSDDRRPRARRRLRRRPAVAAPALRDEPARSADLVRLADRDRRLLDPARVEPAPPGHASSCGSSPPTTRRRRTSTPRARTRCPTRGSAASAPTPSTALRSRGSRPSKGACLPARPKLQVVANLAVRVSSVGFFDGNRQIARVRRNTAGIYTFAGGRSRGRARTSCAPSPPTSAGARPRRLAVPVCKCLPLDVRRPALADRRFLALRGCTTRPRSASQSCVRSGGPGGPGGSDHAYANSAPSSRMSATT